MPAKQPTVQGVGRLLREAGFTRADRKLHGGISGYVIEQGTEPGAVWVSFWWMVSCSRDRELLELGHYAEAVEDAGYAVKFAGRPLRLIVTAGEAG